MPTPLNYRRRARQLATRADVAPDNAVRNTYLEMADRFQSIAERLERDDVDPAARAPKQDQ